MTNLLTSGRATSVAELSEGEIALVGGGDTTIRIVIQCKIDDNGNGQCTSEAVEKKD